MAIWSVICRWVGLIWLKKLASYTPFELEYAHIFNHEGQEDFSRSHVERGSVLDLELNLGSSAVS